ncbi:MAG TPA: MarR family transcriptional regulator [Longimicrobium sp.]|jgi:MarR family 2-MHQ and catechol resistance regulon transcriptional repressor
MINHDEDTAAALKLWVVLNRVQRAVGERARREVERQGLRPTEFAVLEALYHKGPLTLGQVGERVLVTSGSVTPVADKLEKRGLIQRRISAEDRRVCYAELTAAGSELIGGIFPEHAEVIRGAMAGITTEEKRIATALLKRLGLHAAANP